MEYFYPKYCFCVSQKKDYHKIKAVFDKIFPDWKIGIRRRTQFMRNLVMLVINLLYGSIAVSRDKTKISQVRSKWHTHYFFIMAQDYLIDKGLVQLDLGHPSAKFEKGFSSILHPTKLFDEIFKDIERRPFILDTSDIPLVSINMDDSTENLEYKVREYIRGISKKEYRVVRRKVLDIYAIPDNKKLEFREENLRRLNFINRELFKNVELGFSDFKVDLENYRIARNVKMNRSYTCYGTGGGRFNQIGSNSYLQLKKNIRREYLTIDDELTSEVDFASLHPNLLYCIKKIQNPHKDIYDEIVKELVEESNSELRDVLKVCMLVLINSKNYRGFVSAMNQKYWKEVRIFKKYGLTHLQIKEAVCKVHSSIADLFCQDMSHQLMLIESDIMEDILYEMAERKILGVPLHDSIIVQRGNEKLIAEIMKRKYKEHTGFEIRVDTK